IKAFHRDDRKMEKNVKSYYPSIWLDIVHEMDMLKKQGIDVANCIKIKLGNEENTSFWEDVWRGDTALKHLYPIMYALESCKFVKIEGVLLANTRDRWIWTLESPGDFSVALVRKLIDDKMLPETAVKTRWIKPVPIKVNVHAWKLEKCSVRSLVGGMLVTWIYILRVLYILMKNGWLG
nr:RNA-directed DNA polymerase, eukaryota, reverse transcriptase zinc-binding domain protein [Tanacetum cinerariifolium]